MTITFADAEELARYLNRKPYTTQARCDRCNERYTITAQAEVRNGAPAVALKVACGCKPGEPAE